MKLNTEYGTRYNWFEGFLLGFIDLQYYEGDDFEAEENRIIKDLISNEYNAYTTLGLIEVTEEVLHMPEFPWEYVEDTLNIYLRESEEDTPEWCEKNCTIYKSWIRRLLDRFKAEAIRSKQVSKEEVDEAVSRGLNYKPDPETV